VPDRPDRDRLIQIEGEHALRDAAARLISDKEDEDHKRWKEEQQRKKVTCLKSNQCKNDKMLC